ncbi:sugar phosphate isomerase/epimerase [Blastopirellula sp. JC732]|uniref:Sugar phosphate isomerase/epimerase n=1 Tax=Blastopirellula sediminis TaxID=2894196 RepID=A0A9X1MQE0_9BACT|nr:sugar phosphate isomerase/epimerase family protein [Blastopirellula sediminis]MCC9605267.1 sugar phosphate isomerase/epimerase [Blastopirellula sediminis]MCC9631433.1 sugar phosphate isomerase/epimerase [Blastopirellula sediminis]
MSTRRQFLVQSAALTAGAMGLSAMPALAAESTPNGFKKAVKIGMVGVPGSLEDKFRVLKELGFDGVELNSPDGPPADVVKAAIDATGLPVHGVVDSKHWNVTLSDPNPEVRANAVADLKTAIQASKDYGGTSVLLVPGVVKGDVTYDQCWERSIAAIREALPLAEKLDIQILMENVWNNFLTDPKETARFIDELDSEMVGAYFDVGNTVRYSPPHEWIPILGKRIKKLDIKDYANPPGKGFGAPLMEGDVDWPQVMAELKKVGYVGWGTAEIAGGDKERLTWIADRMNKIFAS